MYALSLGYDQLFHLSLRWLAVFLVAVRPSLARIWAYIIVEFKAQPVWLSNAGGEGNSSASHNLCYLDFMPFSRSLYVVDISLTNTKNVYPARFGLRQPSNRFKNTRLFCRVS